MKSKLNPEWDQQLADFLNGLKDGDKLRPDTLALRTNLPVEAITTMVSELLMVAEELKMVKHAIVGAIIFGAWAAESAHTRKPLAH